MSKSISANDLRDILTEYQQSVQTVIGGMLVGYAIFRRFRPPKKLRKRQMLLKISSLQMETPMCCSFTPDKPFLTRYAAYVNAQ